MPEEIEKILELAKPPATQPAGEPTISTSANVSRACGFLSLGSVVLFWLMFIAAWNGYKTHGGDSDIISPLLVGEGLLLLGLSLAAITCAIIGLVGDQRHPGNGKAAALAIVLTLLSVAGFLTPIVIFLSRYPLFNW